MAIARLSSITEIQVESLRDFMKQRLDGFSSGRLYTFDGVEPPDRIQFLWFEFSLLLCLLTADLKQASDAEVYWRRIAPTVLRKASPDISDARLDEILNAARGYRHTWIKHEDDGPLGRILDFPMLAAFDCSYEDERYQEILRLGAREILRNTQEFVEQYRSIVR